jgi:protein-S-isoprenylcysteine O-methyltransferase Ste14
MTTEREQGRQPERIDRRRLALGLVWTSLGLVLCLFLPAGTWAWPEGWLFLSVVVAASAVGTWFLRRANPEVIAARVNRHGGTKRWDRVWLGDFLPTFVSIPVVAALDDGRFHWSRAPWWACGVGYAVLIAGMAGLTWAEAVNRFFEPTVRIQSDRGHTVVDTGPYAVVRHPGYVAACLWFAGIALSLGSLWALIPAALCSALLVLRTRWEDRMLQAELARYKGYTQRVRFKWVPGVW